MLKIISCPTAQKMKFSIKDSFSKCDQIRRKPRIWSHLLKKKLIDLKLDTVYLLSVFLSVGTTVAIFTLSGNVEEVILFFMTVDKGFERTPEANLTNLIENLCVSAAFLSLNILTFFLLHLKLLEYCERSHYQNKIWNLPLIWFYGY